MLIPNRIGLGGHNLAWLALGVQLGAVEQQARA